MRDQFLKVDDVYGGVGTLERTIVFDTSRHLVSVYVPMVGFFFATKDGGVLRPMNPRSTSVEKIIRGEAPRMDDYKVVADYDGVVLLLPQGHPVNLGDMILWTDDMFIPSNGPAILSDSTRAENMEHFRPGLVRVIDPDESAYIERYVSDAAGSMWEARSWRYRVEYDPERGFAKDA